MKKEKEKETKVKKTSVSRKKKNDAEKVIKDTDTKKKTTKEKEIKQEKTVKTVKKASLKPNKQVKKGINKKIFLLIFILVIIISFVLLFTKSSNKGLKDTKQNYGNSLTDNTDALSLGEQKYLEFLWMIDGSFNNERYGKEFTVNGKKMEKGVNFKCQYIDNKNDCVSTNFEDSFYSLFASTLKMDKVYGDGVAIKWYQKDGNKYIFTNVNYCEAGRMDLTHTLKLVEESKDKIVFKASFTDIISKGIYKGTHKFENDFVLVKENNNWKVSKAYYHNPCYMDYYIGS